MNDISLVSIALAAVLVVALYPTSIHAAFAVKNLNSSKSNIYRVHQEQSVDGPVNGPVTQTSTISITSSQSDSITINNNER